MDEAIQEHCGLYPEAVTVQVLIAPSYLGPHINKNTDLCQILGD